MKFKPFAIRNMTEEQVQIMLDKAVEAGADEHDWLGKLNLESDTMYKFNYCNFWGVDNENDTYTSDQISHYGKDAVEITFDQLDEHLGLGGKEGPQEVGTCPVNNVFTDCKVIPTTVEQLATLLGNTIEVLPNSTYQVLTSNEKEVKFESLEKLTEYVELVSRIREIEGD